MEDKNLQPTTPGAIVPRLSGDKNLPAGFDEVDREDLKIARLAILQGLSKIVSEGEAKMGQLANSLSKEVFGDSVDFIPLFMFKTRARFEVGRGLVMLSRDNLTVTMGLDEFSQYEGQPVEEVPGASWDGKTPPSFNLVYNFPVLLAGRLNEFPLSLSLMKTATDAAKSLISQAQYSGEDMFARVYTLKTKLEKGDKGTYAVPVIEFSRRCSDQEYAVAQRCFDMWYRRKKDISVDLEEETATDSK
jgi:hypothetical protein